ncbi:NifU family protein [Pararhodospirillum oryzae]|uniref:NIF system FeS cluster assembly NifU C-terminal domain-containing protein n=1 Tax=Pararhodospirillum oryzae TaxID=478448 RepID=A0A512H7I3_9PROT|nr:NifU family protein [Pararhodospirillum oryzae]GEO81394.1 hypothetical protein ROR02_15250 [Pararhodospirillum oryzae]
MSPIASASLNAPVPGSAAFVERITTLVDTVIRPRLQRDNGDIEIDRIEENRIYVTLTGACVGCQLSTITLSGIQQRLMEGVGRPVRVVPTHVVDAHAGPRVPARVPLSGVGATPATPA